MSSRFCTLSLDFQKSSEIIQSLMVTTDVKIFLVSSDDQSDVFSAALSEKTTSKVYGHYFSQTLATRPEKFSQLLFSQAVVPMGVEMCWRQPT